MDTLIKIIEGDNKMVHEDAGHYAAKHPEGNKCDPQIKDALIKNIAEGKITCAAVHKIAGKLKISPAEAGKTSDILEIRLSKCQLGLFGYGKQKKMIQTDEKISQELKKTIRELIVNGNISCKACWDIAKETGCSKLNVVGVCESLNIKINQCQIGAF